LLLSEAEEWTCAEQDERCAPLPPVENLLGRSAFGAFMVGRFSHIGGVDVAFSGALVSRCNGD
jgi:hypothetical protein